jgi:hypothetical protein
MHQKSRMTIDKKSTWRKIRLHDARGFIFHGYTFELPIKEEKVLKKSLECFGDPAPCMIHRSAVLSYIYLEFEKWFDDAGFHREADCSISELPDDLTAYLMFVDNGKS